MMPAWTVSQDGGRMPKALKKHRGNAPVKYALLGLLDCLEECEDPSTLGKKLRYKYRNCWKAHLTQSVGFIYSVEPRSHTIYALDIGDHKWLHGRDNRR